MSALTPSTNKPIRGYTKLAKFMVGREHVMLKLFKQLAVRDLPYMQAELRELEADYKVQAQIDANETGSNKQYYDRDWFHLSTDKVTGGNGAQWELALKIRSKLRNYYAAIRQYDAVATMRRPADYQRDLVLSYTYSTALGGNCGFLGEDLGHDQNYPSLFDKRYAEDLIFMGEDEGENDPLSRFIIGPGMSCFHWLWKPCKKPTTHDEESGITAGTSTDLYLYSGRKMRGALHIIGASLSSIIPVFSIIALFFVQDLLKRLGLVCLFTFIFSMCMAGATRARRIEIFGATAAFASVQVVFIGGTSS